jgi:hypothetical protein
VSSAVSPVLVERHLKLVRTAGYVILALAALFPLLDLAGAMWPLHFESATWRFGVLGLTANYVMGASIELFLLALLALVTSHRTMLMVLGVIAAILSVLMLGSAVLFLLDAVQTRTKVNPIALHRFDLAAAGALGKMVLFAVADGLLARGVFRAAAGERTTRAKTPVSPVIVGQTAERR